MKHKELKKEAMEYLKKLGHKNIKVEFSIPIPEGMSKYGEKKIYPDVVALDGDKKAIECGTFFGNSEDSKLRKKIINDAGFELIIMPYSEVKRIKSQIVTALEKINPDINKAIEYVLDQYKLSQDTDNPIMREKEITKLIEKIAGQMIQDASKGY